MTGLIYVAIVALWAAVLIPMWLRRHDDDQARRIERHRVAMGTLARIRGSEDLDARMRASRRRRLVTAGLATVGALASLAWVTGFVPGLVALALWAPFVAFVPVSFLAERQASRKAAEAALQERRRSRRARTVDEPARSGAAVTAMLEGPSRASASRSRPAQPPRTTWDDVFDQTA